MTATLNSEPVEDIKVQIALQRSASVASSLSSLPFEEAFQDLVPSRPPTKACEEVIPINSVSVRLNVDASPGCGGIAWVAGEVLGRYLAYRHATNPSKLANKTVLELGSGTGLVGIAAAMLEPTADVWVTDQDILLDLMRANGALNGVPNLHVAELSWGTKFTDVPRDVDVLLAADCVYFEPAYPLLLKTLCDLAPVGKDMEILFCWKKRRKANKRFFVMLKKHFHSEIVDDDDPAGMEVYRRQGVTLLRLVRKK